jgi:hypothetical protein
MTSCRVAALAGMLVFAFLGDAAAQVPLMRGNLPDFDSAPPAPPPGAAPPGGMMAAPPPGGPPPGAGQEPPPCFRDFQPLKEAAEKRAGMIRAATENNKVPERQALCQLFKNFAVAEAKVVKYVTDNQSACHIPREAVTQMKTNHERTVKTRDNICSGGPATGGGPPPGPRLSDELGVRGVPGANTVTPGRGTFDTLMGSPLSR